MLTVEESCLHFSHHIAVAPTDIDALGHVNNARYVAWCEQAAWAHSAACGLTMADFRAHDRAMVLRSAEYDYRQAAHLQDRIVVTTGVHALSSASMLRDFVIVRENDQAPLCAARWKLVCVALSNGRPKRIPKAYQAAFICT